MGITRAPSEITAPVLVLFGWPSCACGPLLLLVGLLPSNEYIRPFMEQQQLGARPQPTFSIIHYFWSVSMTFIHRSAHSFSILFSADFPNQVDLFCVAKCQLEQMAHSSQKSKVSYSNFPPFFICVWNDTIFFLAFSVFVKSYQRRRRRQVKVKDETDQWRILSDLSATWFIKENQQRRLCCLPKIAVRAQRLESQSINTKR